MRHIRKRATPLLLVLGLVGSLTATTPALADQKSDQAVRGPDAAAIAKIVDRIEEPLIPDRDYEITDFRAVGDGTTDALPAIRAAIEKASADGGGRVVLPEGIWLSQGPVHLASNIDLHVSEGATLLFGPDTDDYLPVVRTRWEGTELDGYSPLIYANNVHDVAITGSGTIDGNEDSEFHAWKADEKPDQLRLRQMGFDGVPVDERVFGKGTFLRPSAIQFFHAERVLLEDYKVTNSPFWINHLVYTDQATVRGLDVDSHRANNDGIDVDSSTNVLIEENRFRTGDDSVVVKSGRDLDGRTIARPSENVVIRRNDMGGEDGIALGSEMSGGIKGVYFTDNVLRDGASAIRFKGNLDRGGTVENIRVSNMEIGNFETFIWFQLDYPGELGGNYPPVYRDIVFSDITVASAKTGLDIHGPADAPLSDVTLRDVTVEKVETPMVLENVEDLRFDNVRFGDQYVDGELDWLS